MASLMQKAGAALLLLCLVPGMAGAMTMKKQGDTMVMTGKVVPEDLEQFKKLLAEGDLHQVILAESGGGDLRAALWIARQISAKNINTAVLGHCASSCAVMFMGGRERQMMAGKDLARTRLGFHGPHKKSDKSVDANGKSTENTRAWLVEASGGKFDGALLERAMKIEKAEDIMFFYYPKETEAGVWFCPSGVKPRPRACDVVADTDIFKAGILTTHALLAMDTPITNVAAQAPRAKDAGEAAPAKESAPAKDGAAGTEAGKDGEAAAPPAPR